MSTPTAVAAPSAPLLRTPLYDLHLERGARMVPFAGYALPVQYALGLQQEHHHTRVAASVFDVSHMGQIRITGADAAAFIEHLAPTDALGLAAGRQRYSVLLSAEGGILDDFMFARLPAPAAGFAVVVNGAVRAQDLAHMQAQQQRWQAAGKDLHIDADFSRALLALQGPCAAAALAQVLTDATQALQASRFMHVFTATWQGCELLISRSGYSGEDGFEIALDAHAAADFARALLQIEGVALAGLGARNSLRLEAGLCLYGQDMDQSHTLAETDLNWTLPKLRRTHGARAAGFIGADFTLAQVAGTQALRSLRIAVTGAERVPLREGTPIVLRDSVDAPCVGVITSSVLSPSLHQPIAFARLEASAHCDLPGLSDASPLFALQRGRLLPLKRQHGAFVATRYKR